VTPEEAKRILLACRPGTTDEGDPDVREALTVVAREPALARWWQEQQQVQAALRETFRKLPVPATLKDEILARKKIVAIGWWRTTKFQIAAMAAALTVLLALVFLRSPAEPDTFAQFRDRMVRMAIREYRMDVTTTTEAEIRGFLQANQGHPDYRLPTTMADVPLFGAGRLTWKGQPVSMICFERQAGVLMYLFVIDRAAFATAPGSTPEFEEVVQRPTASWSERGRIYLLASEAGEADLRTLVR